ncbi:MAG: phosphoribosylformylglycinamidine synthase subunit PurQ, partial [Clostridia bacterium]|nr:phosphoribosylformylglycinamidine synthase subunit PurQ [Clostridia bacterium]
LLGAFKAQMELKIAAIGGKDSMSGSFEKIDVPPTLVSFAVTTENIKNIVSPEFKKAGSKVIVISPEYTADKLPETASLLKAFEEVHALVEAGKAAAVYTPCIGGAAEAVLKMAMGNGIGFEFDKNVSLEEIFGYSYGSFIVELNGDADCGKLLGYTTEEEKIAWNGEVLDMAALLEGYENRLEKIYSCNIEMPEKKIEAFDYKATSFAKPAIRVAKPKVLIPVFPGTNCEYDSAKYTERAGAEAEIFVINNLSASSIAKSVEDFAAKINESQIIFIPGGFSGGDEPDGSGKFITAFFRNAEVKDAVTELLEKRDGLMLGICNGFQALIKLGLVPYGKIIDTDDTCPTLTYNTISRHQSKLVRTKLVSNNSPWLSKAKQGEVYTVPISHGEGRFIADEALIRDLAAKGQIITQYVDFDGNPTNDVAFNPNNSDFAIEGIVSPDGRVLGKMGHSERTASGLYKNVPGEFDLKLFESAVEYFK